MLHALFPSHKTDLLIELVGLKRGGLHGFGFWLTGHADDQAFYNNSPLKHPGSGSEMERTDTRSPIPVRLIPSMRVDTLRDGREQTRRLPLKTQITTVVFQSQDLDHLASVDETIVGVQAARRVRILLLRDPFNWVASYAAKAGHDTAFEDGIALWRPYAMAWAGRTAPLPFDLRVAYNTWFSNQAERERISAAIGLPFTDRYLQLVSDHGSGSSFDRQSFDGQAQSMPVFERWRQFGETPGYRAAFAQAKDVVELGLGLFELPDDLRAFGEEMLKQK